MRPDLGSGKPLYGWYVSFQIPDIVEMVGIHWDWVWIDMQHSPVDTNAVLAIIRAAEAAGAHSLVRVGQNDPYMIARALDMGSSGVIVPMVNTPEQAQDVVRAAKFPPAGRRSFGSRRLLALYGFEYADTANEETVVFVQLETAQAMENAEGITAVDGIDGVIFSPDDYLRDKGLNVVVPRPADLGLKEKEAIAGAAKKHAKVAGCFCDNRDSLRLSLDLGYRLIIGAEEEVVINETSERISGWIRQTTAEILGVVSQE